MSCFEILGGILNILQIVGVIQTHVSDYNSFKSAVEEVKTRAKQIHKNVQQLEFLQNVEGVLQVFLSQTFEEFDKIRSELELIEEKVKNRTTLRAIVSSPSTLAQLEEISVRLAETGRDIKLVGLIGNVTLQTQSCANDLHLIRNTLSSISVQFKQNTVDVDTAKEIMRQILYTQCFEITISADNFHRREDRWMAGIDPLVELATGIMFYEGNRDVQKDYIKAARFLHAARDAGKMEASYYLGMIYKSDKGAYRCNATAFKLFKEGADVEHPPAMTSLGGAYIMGVGTSCNRQLGYAYISMGADAGDPLGMHMLSYQMLYGEDQYKNPSRAFQLSQSVVEKGHEFGKGNLGDCYMYGLGVERDASKAVQLWNDALEDGLYSLTVYLGQCYEHGIGVEKDFVKAADYYKRGTEITCNISTALRVQPYYGMCLIRGRGVTRDVKKGWGYIQSSVKADNDSGWFMQGECYRYGYGVQKNLVRAVFSYRKAIKSQSRITGKIRAHYALGTMYESGEGLTRDYAKAFIHYNFGANNFYRDSQWKVASLCEAGRGIDQDLIRAVVYFRMAANSGHKGAQIKATEYYMQGKGVQRNLMTAAQIIQPIADSGDREAKRLLRRIRFQRFFFRFWKSE